MYGNVKNVISEFDIVQSTTVSGLFHITFFNF